jgi:hypothetical protein
MLAVECRQRDLMLSRRRIDEGIGQPQIVTLAIVTAIETALNRQA